MGRNQFLLLIVVIAFLIATIVAQGGIYFGAGSFSSIGRIYFRGVPSPHAISNHWPYALNTDSKNSGDIKAHPYSLDLVNNESSGNLKDTAPYSLNKETNSQHLNTQKPGLYARNPDPEKPTATKTSPTNHGHGGQSSPDDWVYLPNVGNLVPEVWAENYPECGGSEQSPIALFKDDVDVDASLSPIEFSMGYRLPLEGLRLENLGKTIEVVVNRLNNTDPDRLPYISGGALGQTKYDLLQLHFHWGPINSMGSEHMIGNDHPSLECHLVHRKRGLTTKEALKNRDGLAVIAVFFQVSRNKNHVLEQLTDQFEKDQFKGDVIDLNPMILRGIIPENPMDYITYMGSLTTLPCSEAVVWTIMNKVQPITNDQLLQFRNLKTVDRNHFHGRFEDFDFYNFRPVQPLNSRRIRAPIMPEYLPRRL